MSVVVDTTEELVRESPAWSDRRDELLALAAESDDAGEASPTRPPCCAPPSRRLVGRLEAAGWFHFEYRSAIGEVLNFYPYGARILEALVRVARDEQPLFQGYAHSIASLLRPEVFAARPGVSLSEARRNTLDMVRELKILDRNIYASTQRLLDAATTAAGVLEEGLDHYRHAVLANYHRLKTVDNLYKWRGEILHRLDAIERDARAAGGGGPLVRRAARRSTPRSPAPPWPPTSRLLRAQFETLPQLVDDIDARNARFSGVALRKLMYLLRQDTRTEGQLQRIVDALCPRPGPRPRLRRLPVRAAGRWLPLHPAAPPAAPRAPACWPAAPRATERSPARPSHPGSAGRSRARASRPSSRACSAPARRAAMAEAAPETDTDYVRLIYTVRLRPGRPVALSLRGRAADRRRTSAWSAAAPTGSRAASSAGAAPEPDAMDFAVEYPRLEPAQQERFREVVTRLLSGHVLTPGPAMQPDPDWRFAERHRELIDAYLRVGGWRLEIDLGLRLCRAVHESGEQRVRLSQAGEPRAVHAAPRLPRADAAGERGHAVRDDRSAPCASG